MGHEVLCVCVRVLNARLKELRSHCALLTVATLALGHVFDSKTLKSLPHWSVVGRLLCGCS